MASTQKARSGLPIVHKTIDGLKEIYKKNPFLFVLAAIFVGIAAIVIVAFFVLILISFIALPVNNRSGGYHRLTFGSYGGKDIEYSQDNYFGNLVYYLGQQQKSQNSSTDKSAAQYQMYQIWRQAFEETVVHFGELAEVQDAGLAVSTNRLNEQILKSPKYQDESGTFSLKKYKAVSEAVRDQETIDLKENLLVASFTDLASQLDDSTKLMDYIKEANKAERGFTFVSFPFSSYPDSEIKAYGQKNANLFRDIKVSFIEVEKSKSLADSLHKAISSGNQKFSEAISSAAKKGYSGAESVDRSYWEIKDLFADEKDAESVFALAKDAFSSVMKTKDDKYVFFRCQEAAVEPDFNRLELSSKVWAYIQTKEKGIIEAYCTKRAEDFTAKAKLNLDAACKEFGVKANKLEPFAINYGDFPLILKQAKIDQYPELAGLSRNEALLTAAFALKKGEFSKPQVVINAVTVLRLDEETQAKDQDLAMIPYYYYYQGVRSQYLNDQLRSYFLKSPKLNDQFGQAFEQYVLPSTK
jgi:peptidyl-prolyl cis-trans isomerase D